MLLALSIRCQSAIIASQRRLLGYSFVCGVAHDHRAVASSPLINVIEGAT